MHKHILAVVFLVAAFGFFSEADAAESPAPGKEVKVVCKHDPSQTYQCYLPKKYKKGRKLPILYCFGPGGEGPAFVKTYKDACEKHGWIIAASNNARNGPEGPIVAAIKAMWKDTHARLSINDKRSYSTGFSGGSGMAFDIAKMYPSKFAGVIPMAVASTWAKKTPDIPKHISVCFVIGDQDAIGYVRTHAKALKERGNKIEVKVYRGGHVAPPRQTLNEAVAWLDKIAPKGTDSEKPTQLTLKDGVAKRLQSAVKKAGKGRLGGAHDSAQKILDDKKATEEEKADAEHIKKEIKDLLEKLLGQADELLGEKKPYEAKVLLNEVRKSCPGMAECDKAKEKIKAIDSDESLQEELKAGKLFAKGIEYENKGKDDSAIKKFKLVVEKHPDTEYAKRAKKKVEEAEKEKP
ncbi:MAG: hypothetical protein E3J72_00665 [Planctomycetota bacterium]|nr:MAG: hypothetical protein E3J72_00665 [Planctomycetota bacterium]